ncbi:hypothetical protein C8A01DRAFT_35930 [Parachaetomium inaequale]|uniref:Uncharacterized protein n=1 Tax=Parachaetomium inaequale TaxID=2588326 RepID=A0AAN6SS67_9PEZI|nr:hypothetical protein C8A01DRAFT_35930 [Parachaetomium inaequale]
MRFQALTLSLLASAGLATPVRRDVSHAVYTLRLTSSVKSLDGLYLTATPSPGSNSNTTTLGVYTSPSSPSTPTIKFYPVHNPSTNLNELRTTGPTDSSTLAVVGANGLLDFASVADPAAVELPEGTTCDWTSFLLLDDKGKGAAVKYAGGGADEGRWVAFPVDGVSKEGNGGWSVKWKDASAWTTTDYMPVQVVYELVKDE